MKFTVINMGRKDYTLRAGDKVVTLLLFKLGAPAEDGWIARGYSPGRGATPEMLSHLSRDFLNFRKRSDKIAKRRVRNAKFFTAIEALGASLLVIAVAIGPIYNRLADKSSDQQAEIVHLTDRQEVLVAQSAALERQIATLTARVRKLESKQP
jgi:hypothetical protein